MVTHVSAVASIAKCRNKSLSLLSVSTQGVFKRFRDSFSSIYTTIKIHHMSPICLKERETPQGYF